MDDDISNLPSTPPNACEAEDNDNNASDNSDSDSDSLAAFNFDAPATTLAPEGASFKEYAPTPEHARMPEAIRNLGIQLLSKRRAAVQSAMRGGATAWIDQDDSGTYDPKRKRATPDEYPAKKPKKRRVREEGEDDEDGEERELRIRRQKGYSFMITLSLGFEKGLKYLRSITPGPVSSSSSDSDDSSDSSTDSDSGYGSFNKRKRKKRQPARLGASTSRLDGLSISDLTNGHPQRRGCKACFEAGDDECTLIEHSFSYPCEACCDGSVECELILPPALKKVCERCKKKRRSCSYRQDGGRGVEACEQCVDEGAKCCAGPMRESSYAKRYGKGRARAQRQDSLGGEGEEGDVRERMWVSCNQCRGGGKRCSLKGKKDWGPCSCCRKIGEDCKFVLPQTRGHLLEAPILSSTSGPKKGSRRARRRSETPEKGRRKRRGDPNTPTTHSRTLLGEVGAIAFKQGRRALKKGPHHILKTTAFCHPITFNYEPDPMGREPCSWCEHPLFGLFGLADKTGPKTVEGFYYPNGEGFKEIRGGWSKLGFVQTRMCVPCTFERVRMVSCVRHRFRELDAGRGEIDARVWDEEVWYKSMAALGDGDEAGGSLFLNARWCSVCPSLAKYKCCSSQSFSVSGEDGECEGVEEGCGLLLCGECEELMGKGARAGRVSGKDSLDAVVGEKTRNKFYYVNGVRADAEFLTSEGELMVRIGQGMGGGFGSDAGDSEALLNSPKFSAKDKGKGKEIDMRFSPPLLHRPLPASQSRTWGEEGKALEGGGWMNADPGGKMSFGGKIEGLANGMGKSKQRAAINFGEEIRASGKGKERSKWFDREKGPWAEVEVTVLSDDDD